MTDVLEMGHRLRLQYSQTFGERTSLIFPVESEEWAHRLGPSEGTTLGRDGK